MSSNLVVSGLTIQNSPQFHMKFDGCEGVMIDKLSISSPKLSPNTDGIHIENTNGVEIYNSVISNGFIPKTSYIFRISQFITALRISLNQFFHDLFVGDDCVSIGSGCYDVDIRNITCGPGHGIR